MPEEYDSDDIVFKEKKKEDSKNGGNRKQEQSVIEMEAKRATATSFGSKLMKQTGVGFGNAHVGEKAGDLDFSKGMENLHLQQLQQHQWLEPSTQGRTHGGDG